MFDTLPDWIYKNRKYYEFHWDEIIGFIVTSIFAGFILTFNDWGVTDFDVGRGIRSFIVVAIFLLVIIVLTTAICKFIALRLGHMLTYQPHLLGLMAGLVICVASAGYLPIFLPGGFKYELNQRLYVGYWRGYHRPWAIALVTSLFPLLLLTYVLFLSPMYIATGNELFRRFISVLILTAIYSLIPLPNVALEYGGRVLDFFRYLKGMTFGLEMYMNARSWFVPVSTFTLVFGIVAWILTATGNKVGFWLLFLSWLIGVLILWWYKTVEPLDRSRFK